VYWDNISLTSVKGVTGTTGKCHNPADGITRLYNKPEKSQLKPVQQIQFLGFRIDSKMKFLLPEEKILGISQMCQNLLGQARVTIRQLSRLLVSLTALPPATTTEDRVIQKVQVI